jgi:CRISPR-associated protein Cas5t
MKLAIGTVAGTESEICTLYQQLHSYPVGNSGKDDLKPRAKGAKYWITPARREFLVGFNMVLGVQADFQILKQVEQGLRGELNRDRYGLPFAGDNNFLFDRIDVVDNPPPTFWYIQMQPDDPPMRGSYRLTVGIDRADNSKTTSYLYAPLDEPTSEPPEAAWTWTPKPPEPVAA